MKKINGFILAGVGVICLCFSIYFLFQEVLLDVTGHSTTGVVTEKSTSTDEDYHVSYYLSYSYADAAENPYTSRSDVFQSMYDDHSQGSQIPVAYSTAFPSISRIRSAGEGLLPGGFLAAIGGLMTWFGVRMILQHLRWEDKVTRLTTTGDRHIGRLVAVEVDKAEEGEDYTPHVLAYVYTDKTGREHTGKTYHIKARDLAFWNGRIGSAMDVRVNPTDPTDHIVLIDESKLLK